MRTFDTTTSALLQLAQWLLDNGCEYAVLESTGVYWKPVWHVLASDELTLVLANAEHVRNLPGRKSDVKDAQRRGPKKAVIAVAASILVATFYILRDTAPYP